jgi:hypothetical protein
MRKGFSPLPWSGNHDSTGRRATGTGRLAKAVRSPKILILSMPREVLVVSAIRSLAVEPGNGGLSCIAPAFSRGATTATSMI